MKTLEFSAGYVCGAICSHGVVVWNERSGNYLISLESSNTEIIEVFTKNLSNIINKKPKIGTHKRKNNGKTIHMNIVRIYGKKIIEDLRNRWGLVYGKRWSVPKVCFNDAVFRRGFIVGFFDAGAHISSYIENGKKRTKHREIVIYSANKKGLDDIRKVLETENIHSVVHRAGDCFALKIRGKTMIEEFNRKFGFSIISKQQDINTVLLPMSITK